MSKFIWVVAAIAGLAGVAVLLVLFPASAPTGA